MDAELTTRRTAGRDRAPVQHPAQPNSPSPNGWHKRKRPLWGALLNWGIETLAGFDYASNQCKLQALFWRPQCNGAWKCPNSTSTNRTITTIATAQ